MEAIDVGSARRVPWNKGKLTGQKPPLKLKEIWAIRIRLQLAGSTRGLAMFNLAIDSKLRACDLTRLRVSDVCHGSRVAARATVMQQKTQRPVQFEITEQTRASVEAWIQAAALASGDYLFPSRIHGSPHVSTRQYARLVHRWIRSIGLDDAAYGTHTMRRTKASLIYRRTKNLRAVQLLLGHSKLEPRTARGRCPATTGRSTALCRSLTIDADRRFQTTWQSLQPQQVQSSHQISHSVQVNELVVGLNS